MIVETQNLDAEEMRKLMVLLLLLLNCMIVLHQYITNPEYSALENAITNS